MYIIRHSVALILEFKCSILGRYYIKKLPYKLNEVHKYMHSYNS
jgi:hypothetical protein